jgi:hypothetical protein
MLFWLKINYTESFFLLIYSNVIFGFPLLFSNCDMMQKFQVQTCDEHVMSLGVKS